ncbi:MAG: peptidoglycan D,D-transpeptidase FtsI family protein [Phycisphaerales bacterium]
MFHRRLLILSALVLAGFLLPAGQLVRLTLLRGEELRERAEARLAIERYIPTTRGRIVDRTGRVLAADRPSYDLAIDYSVISGQWAFAQAVRQARRIQGDRWLELGPVERERLAQEQLPVYQTALSEAWRHLSRLSGASLEEIELRKSEIIRSVQVTESRMRESERAALEQARREEAIARGRELVDDIEVATAEINVRIREQTVPHVIVRGVSDEVAFQFFELEETSRRTAAGSTGAWSDEGGVPAGDAMVIPGLHVIDATRREYPGDRGQVTIDRSTFPGTLRSAEPLTLELRGLATHVVGWMRSTIYAEDLELRHDARVGRPAQERLGRPMKYAPRDGDAMVTDLGFYREGDRVGAIGIERSAEAKLRGERGVRREQLDTGGVTTTPLRRGEDVPLTIDMALQSRVQALLDPRSGLAVVQPWHENKAIVPDPSSIDADPARGRKQIELGTALSAGAVVLDIDSGDVLAIVSSPTMSHEELVDLDAEEIKRLVEDPVGSPLKNRAIAEAYPPGSIVKPIIFASAVSSGVFLPGSRIECDGMLYSERPDAFRCWVWKQFSTTHSAQLGGPLDASDAIMVSCNIFFYTLGRTLGPERIVEWYGRFGVGDGAAIEHATLGIGRQFTGLAGDSRGPDQTTRDEATLMGMGQGPVAWTPLHAADAYATLARGGVRLVPRLRADEEHRVIDLKLDTRAIPVLLDGLRRAVTDERGSAHHITVIDELNQRRRERIFNAPGVVVWGKSGTADAPMAFRRDDSTNRRMLARDGDHSWCVALAGPDDGHGASPRPRYAIAVVVEFGGSGGRVAGPIVNQIIHALAAEGYLPAAPSPTAAASEDGPGDAGPSAEEAN